MRAAVSLPIVILVAIVIAVMIILIAVSFLGNVSVILGTQTAQGFFQQCITNYKLDGKCIIGAEIGVYPSSECVVSKELSSTGKMDINELAALANTNMRTACSG